MGGVGETAKIVVAVAPTMEGVKKTAKTAVAVSTAPGRIAVAAPKINELGHALGGDSVNFNPSGPMDNFGGVKLPAATNLVGTSKAPDGSTMYHVKTNSGIISFPEQPTNQDASIIAQPIRAGKGEKIYTTGLINASFDQTDNRVAATLVPDGDAHKSSHFSSINAGDNFTLDGSLGNIYVAKLDTGNNARIDLDSSDAIGQGDTGKNGTITGGTWGTLTVGRDSSISASSIGTLNTAKGTTVTRENKN